MENIPIITMVSLLSIKLPPQKFPSYNIIISIQHYKFILTFFLSSNNSYWLLSIIYYQTPDGLNKNEKL